MELDFNGERNFPLSRFEAMLKTNEILFFDADEFELIVSHYLGIGNIALAKKAVKMGLSQHPEVSSLKLLKVEILLFKDEIDRADAILNELYEREPYNPDVYIQKSGILSKKDRHEEAVDLLKTAASLLDDEEEVCSSIALEYMFMEDYEQAKRYFMKCLEYDEEDPSVLYNIIYCFDFLGQTRQAIDYLNMYLDKYPYSETAWHQIGLQYVALEDYEKALNCFDFAIISDDYFVGAYMEKAKVLEELGQYTEAITCYHDALSLEDPTAFAYLHIAKCHEKNGADEKALTYFNKALQEDPLLDKTWLAITDFYMAGKQYRQALYYIERALAIDEENAMYWERYATINKHLKRFEKAKAGIRRSLNFSDDDFETRVTQIDLLIDMNQLETAVEVLEEAAELYSATAEIEYRLAGVYLSLSEVQRGIFHLKKALNLDKEYARTMQELFPEVFRESQILKLLNQA